MLHNKPIFSRSRNFTHEIFDSYGQEKQFSDSSTEENIHSTIEYQIPCTSKQTSKLNESQLKYLIRDENLNSEIIEFEDDSFFDEISTCQNNQTSNSKLGKQNIKPHHNLEVNSKKAIKEFKKINSLANCEQFLLCSQIPVRSVKPSKSINLDDLYKNANNLDILLFKNKGTLSKMQRLFTRSHFDHVAMVVSIDEKRYILQSSGKNGVALSDFTKFIGNLKNCKNKNSPNYQMSYRKFKSQNLSAESSTYIKLKSEQFVRKVLGKKYKFSPMYLLSEDYKKKEQTYFCSQLLAECLKYCGIITLSKPSYCILPGDFSVRQQENEDEDFDMQINMESSDDDKDFLKYSFERVRPIQF